MKKNLMIDLSLVVLSFVVAFSAWMPRLRTNNSWVRLNLHKVTIDAYCTNAVRTKDCYFSGPATQGCEPEVELITHPGTGEPIWHLVGCQGFCTDGYVCVSDVGRTYQYCHEPVAGEVSMADNCYTVEINCGRAKRLQGECFIEQNPISLVMMCECPDIVDLGSDCSEETHDADREGCNQFGEA